MEKKNKHVYIKHCPKHLVHAKAALKAERENQKEIPSSLLLVAKANCEFCPNILSHH